MGGVIGELLPLALGVAISPIPIIAVILMLITPRARSNGLAFLVGWVGAVAIVATFAAVILGAADSAAGSDSSTASSIVRVVLGALLLVLALRNVRHRPAPGETAAMPKWMSALDQFTPVRSLGMAAVLGGVNPKNLVLHIAAGTAIAAAGLSTPQEAVSLVVYVVVASTSIIAPIVVYFALGEKAAGILGGWKDWLTTHNSAVMAVVFLLIGVMVLGKGLGGLF